MTDNERKILDEYKREEYVYDLANYFVQRMSQSGIFAMAVDRWVDWLLKKTDEELEEMAPRRLKRVSPLTKKQRKKCLPEGF